MSLLEDWSCRLLFVRLARVMAFCTLLLLIEPSFGGNLLPDSAFIVHVCQSLSAGNGYVESHVFTGIVVGTFFAGWALSLLLVFLRERLDSMA